MGWNPYALFAKFQSVVLSARAWAKLSDDQRVAVRAAADAAVAAAATQIPRQEETGCRGCARRGSAS